MKPLRLALLLFLVGGAIHASYALFRTIQVIRQDFPRLATQESMIPDGISNPRFGLSMLAWQERRGLATEGDSCPDWLDPDLDNDNDGLTGMEESRQLTSDQFPDSDDDGINDRDDHCPNCVANTYRERIESYVITERLRKWAKNGTILIVVDSGQYLDIDSPTGKNVVVHEMGFYHLLLRTDTLPDVRCGEDGYVRAFTRVFVPGVFYAYEVEQWFGGVCGRGDLVFLVDVPFVGPLTLGEKLTWIS